MTKFLETTVDKLSSRSPRTASTAEGVWVLEENGRVRLGMTDYQQQLNGDVAFVHLKPVGTVLAAGDELAEVETIKATVSFCRRWPEQSSRSTAASSYLPSTSTRTLRQAAGWP